jgi:hypothetical protein
MESKMDPCNMQLFNGNFISVASEKIPSSLTLEQTPQVFSGYLENSWG